MAGRCVSTVPAVPRKVLENEDRGAPRIVHSGVQVKVWQRDPPSVEAVRPSHCPGCGIAARGDGGALRLHGHGRRTRSLWGPLEPGDDERLHDILGRRYRCVRCAAVMLVVPRGVVPRRLYGASAIALALCLWGLLGQSVGSVRDQVSAWKVVGATAWGRWATLRRWVQAVGAGALFPTLPAVRRSAATARGVASHVASWLVGHAPPDSAQLPEALAMAGAGRVG